MSEVNKDLVPKELTKKYSQKEIREKEKSFIVPAVGHYFKEPLLIVGGHESTLVDENGKEFLDLFSGISTTITGYNHPKFVETLKWQAENLVYTSNLYSTVPYAVLAEKLAGIAPDGLKKSFLLSSGSEANEAALFMAKKYKNSPYIIACTRAYHGRTTLAREISSAGWRTVPESHPSGVRFTPYGYCYRCLFGKSYPECDMECAHYLREVIKTQTNNSIAAFIVEPIQGVGGIIQAPNEFFKITHEIVKEFDGLFISDEVQTGFGRTGTKWWGIQHSNVNPDIITMAKSFASGVPIAGFITRPEYAAEYTQTDSFTTFGGNPLSCSAAIAVIDIIQEENYLEKAASLGEYLKKQLITLKEDHELIGEVRGQGIMLGVELVKNETTKEPASEEMILVMEECKNNGLLIGKGGLDGNVIRIQPPLALKREETNRACNILDKALTKVEK
ncbi:MAG: aspartate aminotransferase family protein [Candidatus Lokiarchaeota archaeon]|nr:aspartate aminotransferase family protein [Candidatus Lokiarchaeota archaeon]